MSMKKCVSCGKEITDTAVCPYCKFKYNNLERDTNVCIMVAQPKNTFHGDGKVTIIACADGDVLAELHYGEVFYLKIAGPTDIIVQKTGWKRVKATLRARYRPMYLIDFKNGLFSSKIVVKDISGWRKDDDTSDSK